MKCRVRNAVLNQRLPRSKVDALRQRWNEAISRAKSWEQVKKE